MDSISAVVDAPLGTSNPRVRRWMLAVVALAACITALVGNGSTLPLDAHEVYVARTAEEMLARGDWIVPHLNDQPRINKPPLCYWMVMAVDALAGGDGLVSEWEARVPSIVSGVVMAVATFSLGCLLMCARTAFLGALLLVTSSGYVYYTHCARPEMVYAAFCTLAMVGFAASDRHFMKEPRPDAAFAPLSALTARMAGIGAWVALALATLAKGPQLPVLIVVAWVVALLVQRRGRDVLRVLRPFSGIVILLALTLWWYIAISQRVPDAQRAIEAETLARYFGSGFASALGYADPYYLYRTIGLVLPWAVLYPLALVLPWLKDWRSNRSTMVLGMLVILPLVLLHVSLGRRWYYMLPALAPLTLLMAQVAVAVGRDMCAAGRTMAWTLILSMHVAGMAAGLIVYRRIDSPATSPPIAGIIAAIIIAGILIALMLIRRRRAGFADWSLTATAGFAILFFITASMRGSLWGDKRFERRVIALHVASLVPADATLIGMQPSWEIEQYYAHRVIPDALGPNGLEGTHADEIWLLTHEKFSPELPGGLTSTVVLEAREADDEPLIQLLRISGVRH